jgi:serine protease 16
MCSFIQEQRKNESKASWEILADMARQRNTKRKCQELDWYKTLEFLASPQKARVGGLRSWLWQTCTEFGFYQTCTVDSFCPYAKGFHGLDQDLEICSFAFGIEAEEVFESVQQTLEYYGDHRELKGGSRILSVNGNVDPWETLARTNYTTRQHHGSKKEGNEEEELLPVFMVKAASHHFWTHAVKATDVKEIREARAFIYNTVMKWLGINDEGVLGAEVNSHEEGLI